MLNASNFQRGVVAARPDQMYGWPGLIRLKGNEILAIASERKHHICPFGRVVVMRSPDGGVTWSLPQDIYNGELDDRDGTLSILQDGTITASWFTSSAWMQDEYCLTDWYARRERVTEKMKDELEGDWLIRSTDGGRTWETTPHKMPESAAAHSGPFALSDGRLVAFGHEVISGQVEMCFFQSTDKGDTWSRVSVVPSEKMMYSNRPGEATVPTTRLNERSLLEISPSRFLVLFRATMPEGETILQTQSSDGGLTWDEPKRLPFWGLPPNLIRLSNGAILCSYGHRSDPWSILAILSYDEGRTWDTDNIITLDEWEDNPDMGYPMSLEVSPGEILTVYYISRAAIVHQQQYEHDYRRGSTPEGLLYARYTLK